ncbi:MAG: hypothetical protein ACFB6S_14860 [Geminicoccaceae bacterium]
MKHSITLAACSLLLSAAAVAQECRTLGGTANIRNLSQTEFVVAMTGEFEGGAFARSLGAEDAGDGWTEYQLEHYFTTENGSWIKTRDVGRHRLAYDDRYYGETQYNVVDAGGAFEGMRGSFRSWGAFDYARGDGVLRFDGEICR